MKIQIQLELNEFNSQTQNLRKSLEDIASFRHPDTQEQFVKQVEELTQRLKAILQDNDLIIQTNTSDPELIADLYHRISQSYAHSPDLRVTWLENLAKFHIKVWILFSLCLTSKKNNPIFVRTKILLKLDNVLFILQD